MKNRKKGFTLIEMLMVVAVLGVVGSIITVSLTYTLKDTNQRKCDDFISEIEDAACVYSGLTNKEINCNRPGCEISLELLVREGLVTSETDACTGGDIDLDKKVTVSWAENGEKSCVYNGVKVYER